MVKPFEARKLPEWNFDTKQEVALRDLITACNGSAYFGENIETIFAAVKWLRENPDHRDVIFA